jgi:hypothetical protein
VGADDKPTVSDRPGPRPESPPAPAHPRYESTGEIARGGMGRVVEATDTLLGRVVAVKEALSSDPEALRRFARETRITARLEHPSIVPVYDASPEGDTPYYVMRKVSGRPLSEVIAAAETLPERLALVPHVLAAAQAVAHAHARGIVHRDIKPSNILVGELGETVVIDWGLAKVIGEPDADDPHAPPAMDPGGSLLTRAGVVFGTPGFMSPEQLRGDASDPRSDVYALGATLFYLLARRLPHHSASSTELMALAESRPSPPISTLVPGVPAELSTIVDTALAFDQDKRYADASALAEDLQRFLKGQLVASHQYSRRERLFRFVRKNRGVVVIGSVATVVLAVVGALAISRVIAERNRADAQAKQTAAALAIASDRADQILLGRARVLVESNPTEAIAWLKQLDPGSKRVDSARAIASAAVARGVAWAMAGPEAVSIQLELDPAARQLLLVTVEGAIRVWDLDQRRLVLTRSAAPGTRAKWVLNGTRVLVYDRSATSLLDPVTNQLEPLSLPTLIDVVVTGSGDRVAYITNDRELGRLELPSRVATSLWPGHQAWAVAMPADGSWIAALEHRGKDADENQISLAVALDPDGVELTRHAGPISLMAASVSRHLAVVELGGEIHETLVGPGSPWLGLSIKPAKFALEASYDEELLLVYDTAGRVLRRRAEGDALVQVGEIVSASPSFFTAGDAVLHPAPGRLEFIDSSRSAIVLPMTLHASRVAARRGRSRVALAGQGVILVFDLARALARRIPIDPNEAAGVVDASTVVSMDTNGRVEWHDLVTGTSTSFTLEKQLGLPQLIDVDPERGRALIGVMPGHSRLYVLRKNDPRPVFSREFGHAVTGRLVSGDALVYSDTEHLFGAIGSRVPRDLGALDGPLDALIPLGPLRYAASTTTGELVRGTIEGTRETTRLASSGRAPLAADTDGTVLVGAGNRLMRWSTHLVELTTFDDRILELAKVPGGVVAFVGKATYFVELGPTVTVERLTTSGTAFIADDGRRLVTRGAHGLIEVIELPSRERWELPVTADDSDDLAVAPGSTAVLHRRANGEALLWQLPALTGDLPDELDEASNAVDLDGVLGWPWEAGPVSPKP